MGTKKVSIIGAGSISAAFIMKSIARHAHAQLSHVCSASQSDKPVSSYHPFLAGIVDNVFEKFDSDKIIGGSDVIFLTRPHGSFIDESAKLITKALDSGIKVIDLSADFRLTDTSLYRDWYGFDHNHKVLTDKAAYGLTELNRDEIAAADLVANPGCYPTCALVALTPFIKLGTKFDSIAINAVSGISGAGMQPSSTNIAMRVSENIFPYKVGGIHPHTVEIEQGLSQYGGRAVKVNFTPHVAPFKYGIIETIYVKLSEGLDESKLYETYVDAYNDCQFVNLFKPGELPEVKDVAGTNFVNIGFKLDKRTDTLIFVGCIDNVIKGAAGQAVQNMNVMCGFDEGEGLV